MIPIILHSSTREKTDEFVKTFVTENAVRPENVIRIEPEGKEFSIREIRDLIKQTIYASNEISAYVLHRFDTASNEAQNAFLKTLEEHKTSDQFIMEVLQPYRLLPTIQSRSQLIQLTSLGDKIPTIDGFEALFQSTTPPFNHDLFQIQKYEDPLEPFDKLIAYVKTRLATHPKSTLILKELIISRNRVRENNLNPQYALDRVLIFIYKNSTGQQI